MRLHHVIAACGALFFLQGLGWLIDPARAAAGLGMPLLDGLGRSTQAGDFAAFFLVLGGSILWGSRPGAASTLRWPAALLLTAAAGRILAWLVHGAAFAALFITVEIASGVLLWIGAPRTD